MAYGDVVVILTGADVAQAVDRDAQAVAAQEGDEATFAQTVGSNAREVQEEEEEGRSKRRRTEDQIALELVISESKRDAAASDGADPVGPPSAAAWTRGALAATASTRGAPLRRQAMKSRIIVHKKDGSEK